MNINEVIDGKVYRVMKSKYQFNVGDIVYTPVADIIAVQDDDDEFHKLEMTSGSKGFAMTGMSSGFLSLSEIMNKADCPECVDGLSMRDFLMEVDKTEFEEVTDMELLQASTVTKAVRTA